MNELSYVYDPYTQISDTEAAGHEIPCFRIYENGTDVIAETNEDLPEEIQERYARLFAAAPKLAHALEYLFNVMHDYESSFQKGYIKHALKLAREALTDAKTISA